MCFLIFTITHWMGQDFTIQINAISFHGSLFSVPFRRENRLEPLTLTARQGNASAGSLLSKWLGPSHVLYSSKGVTVHLLHRTVPRGSGSPLLLGIRMIVERRTDARLLFLLWKILAIAKDAPCTIGPYWSWGGIGKLRSVCQRYFRARLNAPGFRRKGSQAVAWFKHP